MGTLSATSRAANGQEEIGYGSAEQHDYGQPLGKHTMSFAQKIVTLSKSGSKASFVFSLCRFAKFPRGGPLGNSMEAGQLLHGEAHTDVDWHNPSSDAAPPFGYGLWSFEGARGDFYLGAWSQSVRVRKLPKAVQPSRSR